MSELEQRVARLEALVKKLMKGEPSTPMVKSEDQFASRIKEALFNIEHVMINRDLMRTVDIVAVMASLSPDPAFSGFSMYDEASLNAQIKMISRKLKLIPELTSLVMTSYYSMEDDEDRSPGNRRFNQSVWVIRNHDKYEALTVTQRCNEYKAQRDRVNVEYRNRCKELGWNKEEYPSYPWFFPTDQGPKVPADKPSFIL
jgi:hypothetical protein